MKTPIYKNIDLVQINIAAGTDEYYLPKNVDWNGRTIDRIVLAAPTASIVSPIDGTTHVLTRSEIKDLYFDLYDSNDAELTHGLSFEQILHTNNNPWLPGRALSLNLSRMYFTTTPTINGCLLLYVFYGTQEVEDMDESSKNITIEVELAAGEQKSFREVMNTTIHIIDQKVRGIMVWDADTEPVYLTLRDHQLSYVLNSVYSGLLRPNMRKTNAENTQIRAAKFNTIDIDFDYSFIRNAGSSDTKQIITFEY